MSLAVTFHESVNLKWACPFSTPMPLGLIYKQKFPINENDQSFTAIHFI